MNAGTLSFKKEMKLQNEKQQRVVRKGVYGSRKTGLFNAEK